MISETKEVFERIMSNDKLIKSLAYYIYRDSKNIIHIGRNIKIDPNNPEYSIKKMKEIERRNGFMFWNNSIEGCQFFKEHSDYISKSFDRFVLNK